MASERIENLPDSKEILFSLSFNGFEINSSAVKTNSDSFVSKLEKTSWKPLSEASLA